MSRIKDYKEREFYIDKTVEYGWTRDVLIHQIEAGAHLEKGIVPGKLCLMSGFQEGEPYPGQPKGNRQIANELPDPYPSLTREIFPSPGMDLYSEFGLTFENLFNLGYNTNEAFKMTAKNIPGGRCQCSLEVKLQA